MRNRSQSFIIFEKLLLVHWDQFLQIRQMICEIFWFYEHVCNQFEQNHHIFGGILYLFRLKEVEHKGQVEIRANMITNYDHNLFDCLLSTLNFHGPDLHKGSQYFFQMLVNCLLTNQHHRFELFKWLFLGLCRIDKFERFINGLYEADKGTISTSLGSCRLIK